MQQKTMNNSKLKKKLQNFWFFEQFQLNLMLSKFIINYVCLLVNFNSERETPQLVLFLLGLS